MPNPDVRNGTSQPDWDPCRRLHTCAREGPQPSQITPCMVQLRRCNCLKVVTLQGSAWIREERDRETEFRLSCDMQARKVNCGPSYFCAYAYKHGANQLRGWREPSRMVLPVASLKQNYTVPTGPGPDTKRMEPGVLSRMGHDRMQTRSAHARQVSTRLHARYATECKVSTICSSLSTLAFGSPTATRNVTAVNRFSPACRE